MTPFTVVNAALRGAVVVTCEHASCAVPPEYANLGLAPDQVEEHIGWDVGARRLSERLAQELAATAVLAAVSRLVVDCNRDLSDHDLIVSHSHGVTVPGNAGVDAAERDLRIARFYRPYHDAVDSVLAQQPKAFVLSVHSFTPVLNGSDRRFDVGVLFDDYVQEAERLGRALAATGLKVRYNQPYSGLDGLIFSARSHGRANGMKYLEIEVNNRLLREEASVSAVAHSVAAGVRSLVSSWPPAIADRPRRAKERLG